MVKKRYAVANWKMNKTSREATDYIELLATQIEKCDVLIYLAVPFTSIAPAVHFAKGTSVVIGAQNMSDAREGAFTGEIAGLMLKEAGASFVILGHSERRRIFHETDEMINHKVIRALSDGLQPILCVGESAQEREAGKTEEVLHRQLTACLQGISKEAVGDLVVAYEPVWAIGTGKRATPEMAESAHAHCRHVLEELFGKRKGGSISLLYGGSVQIDHVKGLIEQKNIDGVLVGGASLDPNTFAKIAQEFS
jgi:triosephosphate isomerase